MMICAGLDGPDARVTSFRNCKVSSLIYHPLFDKYGVDLVLQAHNHNYQRSYPLIYNYSNPGNPAIGAASNNTYIDPRGQVYLVVGTGGHPLYDLMGRFPYMAAQYRGFGLLSIDLLNNGINWMKNSMINKE